MLKNCSYIKERKKKKRKKGKERERKKRKERYAIPSTKMDKATQFS
jgi:hypothetical protein